jgi:hypothetical protein
VEAENKNAKNKNIKPGDVVTFSYGGDSTAKFSAKVLRIRFDLSWVDVVRGFGVDPTLFKGIRRIVNDGEYREILIQFRRRNFPRNFFAFVLILLFLWSVW